MFAVGDLIIYSGTGVCRVENVGPPPFAPKEKRAYYTLVPLRSRETIYVPVDTQVFMRPILAREEADLRRLLLRAEALPGLVEAQGAQAAGARVFLSTIHAAKGLEYDEVVLVDAMEGVLPPRGSGAARVPETRAQLEEETRLMYVAATRARERFTVPTATRAFGAERAESRYVARLLDERTGRAQAAPRRGALPIRVRGNAAGAPFPARPLARRPADADLGAEGIRPGARVVHRVFGEGEVLAVGPRSQMRVRFSDGERLLDAQVCLRAAVLRKR